MSKDSIRNRKKFFSRSEAKIKDLKTMRLNRFDQKTWIYEAWKEKWNEKLEKEDDSPFYKLFCYDYIYRGIEHYPSNGNNSFNDKCNF